MDKNVMSQLDAELEHAGEETALSPKMLLLEQLRRGDGAESEDAVAGTVEDYAGEAVEADGILIPFVRQALFSEA